VLLTLVFAVCFNTHVRADDEPETEQPTWEFTLNGESFEPHIVSSRGPSGPAAQGDLFYLESVLCALPEPGRYELETEEVRDRAEVVYCKDGDERRLVAAEITWTYEDKAVGLNPLQGMKPKELQGLWGLDVDWWDAEIARQVAGLTGTTALTVGAKAMDQNGDALPELSATTRCLCIEVNDNFHERKLDKLSKLKALAWLRLNRVAKQPLDLAVLRGLSELKVLDIRGEWIKNLPVLGELTALRLLRMDWAAEGEIVGEDDERHFERAESDIGFVARLTKLEELSCETVLVPDLAPLEAHPALRRVNANSCGVTKLPKTPPPHLAECLLLGNAATEADRAAFVKSCPKARVVTSWREAVRAALSGIDRILCRTGGTCHRRTKQEKDKFEIKDADEIKTFIETIDVVEDNSVFHCMCCGNPTFEFYRGDELVLMLGYHHGRSMRWLNGDWPGDALLTEKAAKYINALLDMHGVKYD